MKGIAPGWFYNQKANRMDYNPEQAEWAKLPENRRTMLILQAIANKLNNIQKTINCSSMNSNRCLLVLDPCLF